MRRRHFLPALLSAGAFGAQPKVRLGIRTAVFRERSMKEAARLIRQAGFETVQIGLRFAGARFDMNAPDWGFARQARGVFTGEGLSIAGVDGYVNLVHPDPNARKQNVAGLARILEHSSDFGTPIIATETGTYHPGDRARPGPDDPMAGWKQFLDTLRELLRSAEAGNSILAIEPSFITSVSTIADIRRMLDEIASPRLKILWDAAHIIRPGELPRTGEAMERAAKAFGEHIVLAHANDVRLDASGRSESCSAGKGGLDYAAYARLLAKVKPGIALCLEHVTESDFAAARDYVRKHLG